MSRVRVLATRDRRALVGLFAALWVLGFELGPGLHMALHDRLARHQHGHVHHDDSGHGHGHGRGHAHGHGHGHGHGHDHDRGEGDDHDRGEGERGSGGGQDDPQHGEGSLAHRGVAALDPPPPPDLPAVLPSAIAPRPLEPITAARSARPLVVRGRGPPDASA
jgi:hypothetical protein